MEQMQPMRAEQNNLPESAGTGLITMREFFQEAQDREIAREEQQPYTMLFVNVIDFSYYNVRDGIDGGDQILRSMAQILKDEFPGDLISHFDADHFVVLTNGNVPAKVREARRRMNELFLPHANAVKFGAFLWEDRSMGAEEACLSAKIACDSIHDKPGENFVCYEDKMKQDWEGAAYFRSHIDDAVRNDWIKVFYQPIVRTDTGKLCAAEALARWKDPIYGCITPARFLDPLEEGELTSRLDTHMIHLLGKQYAACRDAGIKPIPVSVNLSRVDFLRGDIFREFESVVQEYDIPRSYLSIEVTEQVYLEEDEVINVCINRFRQAGYEVWIDDFGTGYSTMNLLCNHPFDVLKLDRQFVQGNKKRARTIVESLVTMDKKLGARTLAEGVETKEQLNFLRRIGCEMVQGFYLGVPMPFDAFYENCLKKGFLGEDAECRGGSCAAAIKGAEAVWATDGASNEGTIPRSEMSDLLLKADAMPRGKDGGETAKESAASTAGSFIYRLAEIRKTLETFPTGAYIVCPDREILYWNPMAEKITGYSREWIESRRCPESGLNHEDAEGTPLCQDYCPIFHVLETGEVCHKEVTLRRSDGSRLGIHAIFVPVRDQNGTIAMVIELFYPSKK
ncbi:MAG: EAL domain-containing protein [Anaerovoracaceae bacterium]|jgi:PAS domain S-box-containing protein